MTKQEILKMAGVNSEDEFYQLYPNPESFFKKFQNGGNNKFSLRNNPYNAQYYNDKVERDFLLKKNGGDTEEDKIREIIENAFVKLPDINPSSRVRNANNVNRNNVERIIEDAAISANKLNQEYAQQRGVPTYANYYNPRYTGELREDPALSYVPPSVVPGENDAPLMEKPTQTGTDFSSVINKNNKKNTVRKKANNKTTGNPKPSDKTQTNSTDKIQPNPTEVENVLNRDRNNFLDYLYYSNQLRDNRTRNLFLSDPSSSTKIDWDKIEIPENNNELGQEFLEYIRRSNQLRDIQQYYLDNTFKEFKESENISVPTSSPSYDIKLTNPFERKAPKRENTPADWTRRIMGF